MAAALPPHGQAVVVEGVLSERPKDEFPAASDMLMLALAEGREWTESEFRSLFDAAGLRCTSRTPLATGFSAFLLKKP